MTVHQSTRIEHEAELKRRAEAVRSAVLNDQKFMVGVSEGYGRTQQGKVITLAELGRRLGLTS